MQFQSFASFRTSNFDSLVAQHQHQQQQQQPIQPLPVRRPIIRPSVAPDENDYERLLALDENNVPRGVPRERQRGIIQTKVVPRGAQVEQCIICTESIGVGQQRAWLAKCPTHSAFHHACLSEWISRSPTCPVCRKEA